MTLSPQFPTKAEFARAAAIAIKAERYVLNGKPIPGELQREMQLASIRYSELPPEDQFLASRAFANIKSSLIEAESLTLQVQAEEQQATAANDWMKSVTGDMANRSGGLTLPQVAALRSGAKLRQVPKNRVATGAEADQAVRAATAHIKKGGMSEAEYEKKLHHLAEVGPTGGARYDRLAEQYFPGVPRKELDKLVRRSVADSVGIAMQRKSQAMNPHGEAVRPLDEREKLKLDIIEAITEVDEPGDVWTGDKNANVRRIANEESDSLRGAIAAAVLNAGGLDAVDWTGSEDPSRNTELVDDDQEAA